MANIIDIPRSFMARATRSAQWTIDWRGQTAGESNDGKLQQVVFNRFPRWVGEVTLQLYGDDQLIWRGLLGQGRGRLNYYRVPMINSNQSDTTVFAVSSSNIGSINIVTDSSNIPVGSIISHDDYPYVITGRDQTRYQVSPPLRRAVNNGTSFQLEPSGIFQAQDDTMGSFMEQPSRLATTTINLVEVVNRD